MCKMPISNKIMRFLGTAPSEMSVPRKHSYLNIMHRVADLTKYVLSMAESISSKMRNVATAASCFLSNSSICSSVSIVACSVLACLYSDIVG